MADQHARNPPDIQKEMSSSGIGSSQLQRERIHSSAPKMRAHAKAAYSF